MAEDTYSGFDVEILADKTVEMLSVLPNQVIWIWASTHSLDFVEALAYRIRARGAFWMLRLTIEPLLRRIGQNAPEEYLALIPEHEIRWLADINAIVEVRDHSSQVLDVPLARRRAMASEWLALIDEAARRSCRRITVINPTSALAAAYNMSLENLRHTCWRAVDIDYTTLDRQQEQVGANLAKTRYVHVTSSLGTDLHLRVDQRPVHLDKDSIPRGEVYVAPHEDSANGVAIIPKTFIRGKPVERLQLTFANGRVVKIDAPNADSVDVLRELLSVSSGDKDVIAEFAIGLNPGVNEPIGDIMLDEKIGGSIHIAIGMNEHFGGRNKANMHLDLVVLRPKVWLDGVLAIDDGSFCTSVAV